MIIDDEPLALGLIESYVKKTPYLELIGKFDNAIEENYIKDIDLSVRKDDIIMTFTGANMSLGDIFLRFNTREELDMVMSKSNEWLQIILK
jgi:hypothetical protein